MNEMQINNKPRTTNAVEKKMYFAFSSRQGNWNIKFYDSNISPFSFRRWTKNNLFPPFAFNDDQINLIAINVHLLVNVAHIIK